MKSNPGGKISPEEAVGREELIEHIWNILESQSIYMNAERRIGKTTVLDILNSNPRDGWLPAKRDLEACHTALDFANIVYEQIHQFFGRTQKAFRRAKELMGKMGGTEIGGVLRLPETKQSEWKPLLEESFEDLHEASKAGGPRILFLWDEVPFMIDNIRKRQNETTAMEVLDVLRFVRQTYSSVRMVMTGSVGLHHVLATLKRAGYANAPVNDMAALDVPTLTPEKGAELAQLLLKGEKVPCNNISDTSRELAKAADHFPYYIHHLVRQLKSVTQIADKELIEKIVEEQLINPNDPWELRHYRNRIPTYYSPDENVVLSILDVVAINKVPIGLEQISQKISSTAPGVEKERLRSILTLLERDHYLKRRDKGYVFAFPLINQWWLLDRSIA
jgi:hypothetical protein